MAPSKKQTNGRSPLVNPQRQITSFFTKTTSLSPSQKTSNSNPNPKNNANGSNNPNRSPSPSPNTPSPTQSKPVKPLLVISQSQSPLTPKRLYGKEVVQKRIRVYWELDDRWYEGYVRCFDEFSGKHCVKYDDGEEEELDLEKEKFEWVVQDSKFKRLRKCTLSFKSNVVLEDEEMEDKSNDLDDSSDEEWGKKAAKEEETDEEEMTLDDEEEEEEKKGVKVVARKRLASGGMTEKLGGKGSAKKSKIELDVGKNATKVSVIEPVKNVENGPCNVPNNNLMTSDVAERFGVREAEKLWFLGAKRQDAKRRRPGDVGYDPRTLYLPPDFVKKLTGGQRQWWEFKSNHMDKVLFFKMGKFYELFEMDAHVGAKELDLQYMKGEQPHCGFPERNFSVNVEKLARKGYRVLVVEQTETPEQLELRRKEHGSRDKVVKREICAVVTKGTLIEGELLSANPDPSYVMAITECCQGMSNLKSLRKFGVCVVDITTSRVILGQFEDDVECSSLCSLLSELRPVEIIKPANVLSSESEKTITRNTMNPLVNELLPKLEFWDAETTVEKVKAAYRSFSEQTVSGSLQEGDLCKSKSQTGHGMSYLPDILLDLLHKGDDGAIALSALGGCLYYLKQAFLDETLLRFAKYELLPCSDYSDIAQKPYMILDAAALENLEIFENSRNGDSSGTLYSRLNHCVTAFGKRLLRTWLARPLYHVHSIKERQDAVAGLRGINQPVALEFRKALSKLPDMERLLARVFSNSESSGRNANKVVLYEDAAKKQLQEFISALRGCQAMVQACSSLGIILENVKSKRLHYLLTPGKGHPDIQQILKHFEDAFDWVEANNSGRIIPHGGGDIEYDGACKKVKEIESSLIKHLKEQRKLLGDTSINYVTVGKETYLLEVPEHLQRRVPQDYELRSSKKGFYRYWTPYIKKLLEELSHAESEKESSLKNILQRLVGRFCEHHNKWRHLVSASAELDVLISIAIASEFYEGPSCRPIILDLSITDEEPCLSAKSLGHPILGSDSLGKGTFVPNDIKIGGPSCPSFLLLTGPNMGGKSTLLRQVCLAVILAQVGADVPAESLKLTPIDQIFVRMGAKDHIISGQSTFLTELSETALMLSSATHNSLVALDELGRGTSTSDGQAIAESVLEHFVHKVQCRGMFSTHYHRLAVDYETNPKVSLCHMACQVGNGLEGIEEVTFLYRLMSGACPKSYGVNVARLAGLPDSVLQKAACKSREFEAIYGNYHKGSEGNSDSEIHSDKVAALIRNLINTAGKLRCRNPDSDSTSINALTKLQLRTKRLMQQS